MGMSPKEKRPQHRKVSEALNKLLHELGWTQAAIAAELGVHRQAVHAWVHRDVDPTYSLGDRLVELASTNTRHKTP